MNKNVILVAYALLMIAVIVTMDVAFFRHHFMQRLIANVSVVLVFIVCYLAFLRHV